MPQVLKEGIEERIRLAALEVLAEVGLPRAPMAEIAARAGVSAGNIYHYFAGKQELFDAVVPAALARQLRKLLRRRIAAGSGAGSVPSGAVLSEYADASEATVQFALAHRLEAIILLGRAEKSPHARLAEEVVGLLIAGAVRHWRVQHPRRRLSATVRFDLELIYRSWLRGWVALLERYEDAGEFREALAGYERYHLEGLRALLA